MDMNTIEMNNEIEEEVNTTKKAATNYENGWKRQRIGFLLRLQACKVTNRRIIILNYNELNIVSVL